MIHPESALLSIISGQFVPHRGKFVRIKDLPLNDQPNAISKQLNSLGHATIATMIGAGGMFITASKKIRQNKFPDTYQLQALDHAYIEYSNWRYHLTAITALSLRNHLHSIRLHSQGQPLSLPHVTQTLEDIQQTAIDQVLGHKPCSHRFLTSAQRFFHQKLTTPSSFPFISFAPEIIANELGQEVLATKQLIENLAREASQSSRSTTLATLISTVHNPRVDMQGFGGSIMSPLRPYTDCPAYHLISRYFHDLDQLIIPNSTSNPGFIRK